MELANDKVWVVSADMGLGHQRATYPLRDIACDGIYLFGDNITTSARESRLWTLFRSSYESLSRTGQIPLVGSYLFSILEKLQNISPYYPFRDQSKPSLQLKFIHCLIKKGMGLGLGNLLSTKKMPVVTSFYAVALAVEEHTDLPVYCIICDTDINRVWVSENPKKSRIIYLAPCSRAMKRLKQYGVPDERIYITGFPLPQENLGGPNMNILKQDLSNRLIRLDPSHRFRNTHGEEAKYYLGEYWHPEKDDSSFTVTFSIGGAGAQSEIAAGVIKGLASLINKGKVKLNLVAAHRTEVKEFFLSKLLKSNLTETKNVQIIYNRDKNEYFKTFNRVIRSTDVLWTKPSELTFYCGLGIPIIISPPIGPHEVFNKQWIRNLGAGLNQEDPKYCGEWLIDYLNDGKLAQAAWDGFLYARKLGTYKIMKLLATGDIDRGCSPLSR